MLRDSARLFGTDGVRGVANLELTPEFALALGKAAGFGIAEGSVLIGRDTRRSGEMLSMALQAGFHSAGVDTVDVGVLPSGAISYLTAETGADLGAVVSASHNPAGDNGIKFLSPKGTKLSDSQEDVIEAALRSGAGRAAHGSTIGTRFPMSDALPRYLDKLAGDARFSFMGISVVLDCANGAAYQAAPALFSRLKAQVKTLAAAPDGNNINLGCGATHPEFLRDQALGSVGLAFDGDADRLIAIDETGKTVDGDATIAILARHLMGQGKLQNSTVVVTVMSNLGFHQSMRKAGITVIETKVGDRYVAEAMAANRVILGGEQSGHVICSDRGVTGDGLLTAVRLLEVMAATGKPLSELHAEAITVFPQVLENVRVEHKERLEGATRVWDAVRAAEKVLGAEGRVLVRASGTEPLVRVMVEASEAEDARHHVDELAAVVAEELG